MRISDRVEMLQKNVKELQDMLGNANIRIQHLTNMLRIEEATTAKMIKILKLDIKETK
jgi:hypothetical protein